MAEDVAVDVEEDNDCIKLSDEDADGVDEAVGVLVVAGWITLVSIEEAVSSEDVAVDVGEDRDGVELGEEDAAEEDDSSEGAEIVDEATVVLDGEGCARSGGVEEDVASMDVEVGAGGGEGGVGLDEDDVDEDDSD